MKVGDEAILQVTAERTMPAVIEAIESDRNGVTLFVFRFGDGSLCVMPDTLETAKVIKEKT